MTQDTRTKTRGIARALWSLVKPDGFQSRRPTHKNLRYRTERYRGIKPHADLYLPEGPGPYPSLILVHGGGYLIGSKSMKPMRFLATRAVASGWAALSVDYRMIFRGGRFAEGLNDVSAATNWWLENASHYGCDPQRIAMLGVSAGAALMLNHMEQSQRTEITHLVSVYGVYDFTYLSGAGTRWLRKRAFRSMEPSIWAQASPVGNCHTPRPLLVLHGESDTIVPVAHAHRLSAHRESEALPTQVEIYPGAEHSFLNDAKHPATLSALNTMWAFLGADDA